MVSNNYLDGFIPAGAARQECIKCGICLQNCPVMKMEPEEAEAEINRLLKGEETKRVLNECTFCFSCNHYCPHGLKPYNLIMERMAARNREINAALPPFVNYMINGRNEPGFFNNQYEKSSDEDKTIIKDGAKFPLKQRTYCLSAVPAGPLPLALSTQKFWHTCLNMAPGISAAAISLTGLALIRPLVRSLKRRLSNYLH